MQRVPRRLAAAGLANRVIATVIRLAPLTVEAHPDDEMLRYSVAAARGHEDAGFLLYLDKGRQIAESQLALAELAFPAPRRGAMAVTAGLSPTMRTSSH